MMAVLLVRMHSTVTAGGPENFPYPYPQYFSDVSPQHPNFSYIQRLYQLGLTLGLSAPVLDGWGNVQQMGIYGPDDSLTNLQAARFAVRLYQLLYGGGIHNNLVWRYAVSCTPE